MKQSMNKWIVNSYKKKKVHPLKNNCKNCLKQKEIYIKKKKECKVWNDRHHKMVLSVIAKQRSEGFYGAPRIASCTKAPRREQKIKCSHCDNYYIVN